MTIKLESRLAGITGARHHAAYRGDIGKHEVKRLERRQRLSDQRLKNILRHGSLQGQLGVQGAVIFHLDTGAGAARQPGKILVDVRSVDTDKNKLRA